MSSCAICLEAELRTPAACVPCGHTFCHACITQWTSSPPRFSVSLCPQCRAPVREVQKLFISDWPVAGGNGGIGTPPPHLSPWQQFTHLLMLLSHFLAIPLNAVAHYGPEIRAQLIVWLNQQLTRAALLKTQVLRYAAVGYREWLDLGMPAQCLVGGAFLLVAMLLVQDLQDEDGVHRGIVLPILLVFCSIVKQMSMATVYILYRPLTCLAACLGQVGLAVSDICGVLARAFLWTTVDLTSIPWLLLCILARAVLAGMSLVASFVRVVVFFMVACLLLGVPAFLASPNHQEPGQWAAMLVELGQAALEWLRFKLQLHRQRVTMAAHHRPTQGPDGQIRNTYLRDILTLLTTDLQNEAQRVRGDQAGRHGIERQQGGEWEGEMWQDDGGAESGEEGDREEEADDLWQWDDDAESFGGGRRRHAAGEGVGLGGAEERQSGEVRAGGSVGQNRGIASFWRNFVQRLRDRDNL